MQTVTDISSLFTQDSWDRQACDAIQRSAFVAADSCDQFKSQIAQLERDASSGAGNSAAFKLGFCQQILGHHRAAADAFNKAKPSGQRDFYLARSLRELGRYDDAVATFDRARSAGWDELECACEQAETLLVKGDLAGASALIDKHARAGSNLAIWHFVNGRRAEAAGSIDVAMSSYEKSVELDPQNGRYVFRLAFVCDLHGDDQRALELYRSAAELPVVFANALLNLAVIYEDLGEFHQAINCIQRVLAVDPNHARARLFLLDVESSTTMIIDEDQERESERRNAVLDIAITEFELSVRARNCLKKMNIRTLGDLLKISETELLAYKNFGETSLNEIKAMLTSKGLRLGQLAEAPRAPARPDPRQLGIAGNPETLSRPVAELELSVRSRKCLQRLNIATIGELCSRTEQELLATRNFGQTSLNEIKRRLTELNLRLRRAGE